MTTTKSSNSHCIFCTSVCPPSFSIINGKPVKLKTENETESKPFLSSNFESGAPDDSCIESHLRVIFILRKILDIEVTTFSKFLGKSEGQFHPGLWISLCPSCDQLVGEFWEKLKEIGRLERRLKCIKSELTGFVQDTQAFKRNGAGVDPVWNEIRKNAVAGTGSANNFGEESNMERLMVATLQSEDKFAVDDEDGRFTESDGEETLIKVDLLDNNKLLTGLVQDTQGFNENGAGEDPVWNEIRKNAVAEAETGNDFEEKFPFESVMVTTLENQDKIAGEDEVDRFPESDGEEPLIRVELLENNKHKNVEDLTYHSDPLSDTNLQAQRQTRKRRARNFGCSVCSKSFDSEERLKTHYKNYHTTLPCKSCDKTFPNLKLLTGHEKRAHTPKGSFPCPTCFKEFASYFTLWRHKRSTHEKRTSHCSMCDRSFKSASSLSYHVNTVHNPAPVPCPHCPTVFCHKRNLNYHLKLKHSD